MPCVRLVRPGARELIKYKPKNDKMELNTKNLYQFYNHYKRRRVKPYLKSEKVPE